MYKRQTQTRRILRSAPQELPLPFMAAPAKLLDASIQKADASFIGDETAVYSRCDQNHHLNNTSYADILCDHLPHSLLLERQIPVSYTHLDVYKRQFGHSRPVPFIAISIRATVG